MSPWAMILLGIALVYVVVGIFSYFEARTDTRYSDQYNKKNARHKMFAHLMGLTVFLVVVAVAITAFVLVSTGILDLLDPYAY